MSTRFEEFLAREGYLVYRTRGISMEPMLKQDRDLVVIRVPSSRLRKYDVALYRRGGAYVLHRVVRVRENDYLIRGDNTYRLEIVPDSAVLGVLTEFQRKGRKISVENRGYRLYIRVWDVLYPVRFLYKGARRLAGRAARRAGIWPPHGSLSGKGGAS